MTDNPSYLSSLSVEYIMYIWTIIYAQNFNINSPMKRPWKLEFRINDKSRKAIYLQIADAIISDIQSGRLKSGDLLPGTRSLAEMLNINRNTIVKALNVLFDEEWIFSVERKGTFIAETLPQFTKPKKKQSPESTVDVELNPCRIIFDNGYPDSKIAPVTELARAYRQIFNRNARWQMMGYGNELGDAKFIEIIVQMLNHQRGMNVREDAVCITRGSQMAMFMLAHCYFKDGDCVIVENPGYKSAWKAFQHAGATLLQVGVDDEGLIIDEVIKHLKSNGKIKAVYTTPHHQYPTTVTLSLQRRHELLRLSNEYNFTIIEDDYDNEFHYGYRPIFPLCSFSDIRNYIYIGTLSKVVAPALRIGYIATSIPGLIQNIGQLRKIIDVQGDRIMEQAVLQLIEDGVIKRHIKKATHYYRDKRDFTASLLEQFMKDGVSYNIPGGGLAFWIKPKRTVDWQNISQQLIKRGVKIITPDNYYDGSPVSGMRLSFGTLSNHDLRDGIKILSEYIT